MTGRHYLTTDQAKRIERKLVALESQVGRPRGGRRVGGPIPFKIAKADDAIAAGGTGTATEWISSAGEFEASDAVNFPALNVVDWLGGGCAEAQKLRLWRHAQSAADSDAAGVWLFEPVPFKSLVRFTLDADLDTSDLSEDATIVAQYGPGEANVTAITVHNLLKGGGGFVFEGDAGAAGLASWDAGTDYRIIQMECPP